MTKWTDSKGRLRDSDGLADSDTLTVDDLKPLEWFIDSGLLWLFNAILSNHDTAISLATYHDVPDGRVIGWFVHEGEPIEVVFDEVDDDRMRAAREVLGDDVVDAIWAANGLPIRGT